MAGESVLAWLRPFLLAGKMLGLFPLKNVHGVGREGGDALRFKAWSTTVVYSVVFLPCMLACTYPMILKQGYMGVSGSLADDIATKCQVGMVIVLFFATYVGTWMNVRRYPAFLDRVRRMEERLELDEREERPFKRVGVFMLASYAILFLNVALASCLDVFVQGSKIENRVMYLTGAFFYYVLYVASLTPELIFVYSCHVLRIYGVRVLEDLSDRLKSHVAAKRDVPVSLASTAKKKIWTIADPALDADIQSGVDESRDLYLEVSSLADTLSGLHSPGLLLSFLCNSVMATVMLYHGASAILQRQWVGCLRGFSCGLVSLFRMGHVAVAAGNVFSQVRSVFLIRVRRGKREDETQAKLKEISTTSSIHLSDRLSQQVHPRALRAASQSSPSSGLSDMSFLPSVFSLSAQMILFELQMSSHPVKLTASDYFTLGKGVMTSGVFSLGNDETGGPRFRYCSWAFVYGLACVPVVIALPTVTVAILVILCFPYSVEAVERLNGTAEGRGGLDDIIPSSGSSTASLLAERISAVQWIFVLLTAYLINIFKGRQLAKLLRLVQNVEEDIGLEAEDLRQLRRHGYLLPLVYVWTGLWCILLVFRSEIMPSWCEGACETVGDISYFVTYWVLGCLPMTADIMFVYLCKCLELISVRNLVHLKGVLRETKAEKVSAIHILSKTYCNEIDVRMEIEKRRGKYFEICELAAYLSRVFHPTILLRIAYGIVLITTKIYLTVDGLERQNLEVMLNSASTVAGLAFLLVFVARAGGRVGTETEDTLMQISKECSMDLPPRISQQMMQFQMQVSLHPIGVSSSNYFQINKPLLTAVFGTIFTYLVVLLQFHIEEVMGSN
ncbi:unnamed protein product [Darwinula stevensoni]|uniref:Gustatory receptor n=1 Tax=Darwinula stevensoni TaxID=69355 RepID=A0A7R8X493_9CRUS|nr:unnamed protein product [Darwinula stevensoni]CAG0885186.1 unnamed protein product [Darwinula stevensoni]